MVSARPLRVSQLAESKPILGLAKNGQVGATDVDMGLESRKLIGSRHISPGWVPTRSTFVFFLVMLHLGVLCYWCYLMYLSHRRAKAAAAAKSEARTPPPRVNCTYDWPSYSEEEAPVESGGFLSRFKLRPFLEKKNSGRPVMRSELATIGISNLSLPSRPRITRTPTLPSTPEIV